MVDWGGDFSPPLIPILVGAQNGISSLSFGSGLD